MLSLLLQPETKVLAIANDLRQQAITSPQAAEVLPMIPAILLSRFHDRPIQEICAMGGITLEEFTQSRAYREIFDLGEDRGRQEGRQEGRRAEACNVTLRLLARRCGPLSDTTTARIEALLDFRGPGDLTTWLTTYS